MPPAKKTRKTEPDAGEWIPDVNDLGALELEEFCAELGIEDPADIKSRLVAGMHLAAVMIARRTYPDIPLKRWETLRLKDLNMDALHGDEGDPTLPA
jgi:hypothetical protein